MGKSVALSLVTFNRSKLLIEMLESVLKQTIPPDEIFIVDNNSSDNTKELVLEFADKYRSTLQVNYYNTGENLGGAGGFELGSKLAYNKGYEWIWLADDDVELTPECLENLLKHKDKAAILQPMRVNMDGSCAEVSGTDYKINSLTRLNPKQHTVAGIGHQNWEAIEVKTIPFEGPLINRKVFKRIGFSDPRFFIFYDDLDFSLRAQQAGFKIFCVREAVMKRKIRFVQSKALTSWKGYFMYRNFFRVQIEHSRKPIGICRNIAIFSLVLGLYILTGRIKAIPMLFSSLKDALNKNFPLNQKYKPN